MAVDSYAATSLAKAMGHSTLDSLAQYPEGSPTGVALDPQFVSTFILGLANDVQVVLGAALVEATTMFPHMSPATPSRGTLPRHLRPKTVRDDVFNIRRRAKAICRLVKHEARKLTGAQYVPSPRGGPSLPL